ncbi:Cytochrome c oxidase copper chaperone [Ascosphaera atra]|nr:Cytochrome c oxidase copper chaperone [Ascosphaera atra]
MSSQAEANPIPPAGAGAEQQQQQQENKPKPCCVCKDEKSARDDCMLFSKSDDPAGNECKSLVEKYKECMAGYGFKV